MQETFRIIVDSKIYKKEAVFAASRELTPFAQVIINSLQESDFAIDITPLDSCPHNIQFLEQKLNIMLIDSQFRIDLNNQFGTIRDLIVKQAFSPIADLKQELKKA